MGLAAHLNIRVFSNRSSWLVEPPVIDKDNASADQRLGAGSRLGKPALDEKVV